MKRESTGRYTFDGNLDRMCVCGHTLGVHSCGDDAGCIFYSLSQAERLGQPGENHKDCGCQRFRQSRRTLTPQS